jgi:hypothetical protein
MGVPIVLIPPKTFRGRVGDAGHDGAVYADLSDLGDAESGMGSSTDASRHAHGRPGVAPACISIRKPAGAETEAEAVAAGGFRFPPVRRSLQSEGDDTRKTFPVGTSMVDYCWKGTTTSP